MSGYRYHDTPALIRDFLVYMETIKGKSSKTINEYFFDLRTFFRYMLYIKNTVSAAIPFDEIDLGLVDENLIKSVTLSDVYDFFSYAVHERGNQSAARARKVSAIRSFYKYLTNKAGILDENPVSELDYPKLKQSLPRYLTIDESICLLNAISGPDKIRDYAIIAIFLNCGLRLSELSNINLSDIRDDQLRILGKGNRERTVYLNNACMDAIKAYMRIRPVDGVIDKNALFLSYRKTRLGNQGIQKLVKKHLQAAGLDPERYSVHKLRHTAATLMHRNGVDVRVLQEVLGHTNLGTTQIYTHIDDENLKNAAEANPLSKVQTQNTENTQDNAPIAPKENDEE